MLAPLLAVGGYHVAGLFLTGINEDTITEGYRKFKPGIGYLWTPIFLSTGAQDKIATPAQQNAVKLSMQRTGFSRRLRHETFPYRHVVKKHTFKKRSAASQRADPPLHLRRNHISRRSRFPPAPITTPAI